MGTQKPERPVPVPRLPGKYRQSTAPRNGAPPRPRRSTNPGLLAVPQNDTKTEQNYHGCKLQPEPTSIPLRPGPRQGDCPIGTRNPTQGEESTSKQDRNRLGGQAPQACTY